MRFLIKLILPLLAWSAMAQQVLVLGDDPGSWTSVFGAVGVTANQSANLPPASVEKQIEAGAFLMLQGSSEYAERLGIRPSGKRVPARSMVDVHQPKLPIVWEQTLELPVFELPKQARVFARERWTGAPLLAGWTAGKGAVLWAAATPGKKGYERFPMFCKPHRTSG